MTLELDLTRDPAHIRHGSNIGQPLARRDGVLKVTGRARYAADNHPHGMLYAVLAVSSIARGRVAALDIEAAKAHPGVVEVMTHANRPPLSDDPDGKPNPFAFRFEALQNDRVRYANQPIAVVIAESLGGRDRGRGLAGPPLRGRAGAHRPQQRGLHSAGGRHGLSRRKPPWRRRCRAG